MAHTIQFPSVIEFKTFDSGGPIPLSETDALIFKSPDYDKDSVVSVAGNTQLSLYIDFVKGSLTDCDIILYLSPKGNPGSGDWYKEVVESESGGILTLNPMVIRLTTDTKIVWHNPIGATYAVKVAVKGNGALNTGSSIKLQGALRVN